MTPTTTMFYDVIGTYGPQLINPGLGPQAKVGQSGSFPEIWNWDSEIPASVGAVCDLGI